MSCPECAEVREQYQIFVKTFRRFGLALEQLEVERRRILDRSRPAGARAIGPFEAIISSKK